MSTDVDEIVFQVLVSRMAKKRRYTRELMATEISGLLNDAREVISKEPTLLELPAGIIIVGDMHGNVEDLIRIFERLRYPPATRYLFLGDYVDRGQNGLEVMLLLFALKVKFPQHVYLIRGNHESQSLTNVYGFQEEMMTKYNYELYNDFIQTFYELPMAAIVGQRIFCVHGGISPELHTLDDIKKLEKPKEIGLTGMFSDMVWSDPDEDVEGFQPSHRGCGFLFGPDVLEEFLAKNELDLLVRSHEMCDEGVHWPYADEEQYADSCITVFSNSDYCGRSNSAAVLKVTEDLSVSIEIFEAAYIDPSKRSVLMPYWLSDFIKKKEAERAARMSRLLNQASNAENINTNSSDVTKITKSTSVVTSSPSV